MLIERVRGVEVALADLPAGICDENRHGSVGAGALVGGEALPATACVPEARDAVWLSFDPRSGHEQAGHRRAPVLGPAGCDRTGLVLRCPTTTRVRGDPLEVPIDSEKPRVPSSVVLPDRVGVPTGGRGGPDARSGRSAEPAAARAQATDPIWEP